ncbi:MAG: large conductance mechanosensitive channel protein MscL [Clostridia bacterium]|nr:large conductance mechanosensitive channel protein MscL [Clostridia bacterium]MBQ9862252.1 large conductance mechanosensitive channel protein MscL [Clostridia bacterium]
MKKFFEEFKEFISKGNVIDMAVAVIIGNAFKAIITALVDNVIMPLISLAVGGLNFTEWKWVLTPATVVDGVEQAEVAVSYGILLQAVIDFLIVAFCIFVALKILLAVQTKTKELLVKKAEEEAVEEAAAEPAETEMDVLRDIRELLKSK